MNRRSFFKTIVAGTAGLFASTLPSPAEPKPQIQTISFDCPPGNDTAFVSVFSYGKLIDCREIDPFNENTLMDYLNSHEIQTAVHANWMRVNDNYF